jgi:hypothetical protein
MIGGFLKRTLLHGVSEFYLFQIWTQIFFITSQFYIVAFHIGEPLLGKDLETNNETTAVAMQ